MRIISEALGRAVAKDCRPHFWNGLSSARYLSKTPLSLYACRALDSTTSAPNPSRSLRRWPPANLPNQRETRSDDSRRPEVIVEFLFDRGGLSIAVRNIGERPAIKVSVKFNKKIVGLGGAKEISALNVFKNVEFLGPGREITTFVDASSSYFKRKQPTKISARISYSDSENRKYDTTINHDLENLPGHKLFEPA